MGYKALFDRFDQEGRLFGKGQMHEFSAIPWADHPQFEGVALKAVVTSAETGGRSSCHLVRVAPGKTIGLHTHDPQLEIHEVIAGGGVCVCGGQRLEYAPGVIAVLPAGVAHELTAGPNGLYLFAKFMPALV